MVNVDDVVRIKIEEAARKVEAACKRRDAQRAARERGLAKRHAQKLRNLAAAKDAAGSRPEEGGVRAVEVRAGGRVNAADLSPAESVVLLRAARILQRPAASPALRPKPFPKARVRLAEEGAPAAGTVVSDGATVTLYVGHVWLPDRGEVGAVLQRLQGCELVEVVGATWQAAGRARALLRNAWKAVDALVSGLLPADAEVAVRTILGPSQAEPEGESA